MMRGVADLLPGWRRAWRRPPPMPVVVGVGRSGTTLLRLMLDSHPLLAMPPETAFLPAVHACRAELDAEGFVDLLAAAPTWPDFHLDAEALRSEVCSLQPFSTTAALRLFYHAYAARFGKPRCGDKTPFYCRHLPAVEALLPEAHFIHLIRDGRDVALSLRPLWFAPGRDMATLAGYWQEGIAIARRDGARCRRYLEVRYEELIADPAGVLRRICDFVALPYAAEMLSYPARAAERIGEVRDQSLPGRVVSREQRLRQHPFVASPPRADRSGRWRSEMDGDELREFERVAGGMLTQLGYQLGAGAVG